MKKIISLRIEEDVVKRARIKAIENNTFLSHVVEQLLREWIRNEQQKLEELG